jgi:hypothetical protein
MVSKRFKDAVDRTITTHALNFTAQELEWQCAVLQRMSNLTELHAHLRTNLLDPSSPLYMLAEIASAARYIQKLHVAVGLDTTVADPYSVADSRISLAAALRALVALQSLSLTSYGDMSAAVEMLVAAVQHCLTLRSLSARIVMGKAGMQRLVAQLQSNETIQSLDLRGTAIGDTVACILAAGLTHNTTLKELNLGHVRIWMFSLLSDPQTASVAFRCRLSAERCRTGGVTGNAQLAASLCMAARCRAACRTPWELRERMQCPERLQATAALSYSAWATTASGIREHSACALLC